MSNTSDHAFKMRVKDDKTQFQIKPPLKIATRKRVAMPKVDQQMQLVDTEMGQKIKKDLEAIGKRRSLKDVSITRPDEEVSRPSLRSRNEQRSTLLQGTLTKSKVLPEK